MHFNSDLSLGAAVTPDEYRWVSSPQSGVERMMLDRDGGEQARATSIVRYARGSTFPHHTHPLGEEILVLAGTLSDETGSYPAGWYLRNPPGSSHRPSSTEGTLIFVKLRQMCASERQTLRIDTRARCSWSSCEGRLTCRLFGDAFETVRLECVPPGAPVLDAPVQGVELLVLEGELGDDAGQYPKGSWLRFPVGDLSVPSAGAHGATIYIKTGHLGHLEPGQ